MEKNKYLASIYDAYCSGRMSSEVYDAALMNVDEFCEEPECDQEPPCTFEFTKPYYHGVNVEELLTALMVKLYSPERTEIAFRIGPETATSEQYWRYFSIQECDDGYDYTLYHTDYTVIDGGVYDNLAISILEAAGIILTHELSEGDEILEAIVNFCDKGICMDTLFTDVDYEELMEKSACAEIADGNPFYVCKGGN